MKNLGQSGPKDCVFLLIACSNSYSPNARFQFQKYKIFQLLQTPPPVLASAQFADASLNHSPPMSKTDLHQWGNSCGLGDETLGTRAKGHSGHKPRIGLLFWHNSDTNTSKNFYPPCTKLYIIWTPLQTILKLISLNWNYSRWYQKRKFPCRFVLN